MSALSKSTRVIPAEAPESSIREICRELLSGWQCLENSEIHVSIISGGITNALFKATPPSTLKAVLVRVYGPYTEKLIDREIEVCRMQTLVQHGFGAQVLALFGNGRIETFLDSRPLEPDEMGHPDAIPRIAARLAEFHSVQMNEIRQPQLFRLLNTWLEMVQQIHFPEEAEQKFFVENIDLDMICRDVTHFEEIINALGSPIVFCHNDLLSGNILLLREDGKSLSLKNSPITIIDFEYAFYSYRGFDLGNHFNEYAGFEADFSEKYPSVETQRGFMEAYLAQSRGRDNVSDHPSVESLIKEAATFAVLSHLYWGIWSIIQARYSTIDFDFLSYAMARIDHYMKGRHLVLKEI